MTEEGRKERGRSIAGGRSLDFAGFTNVVAVQVEIQDVSKK
jgi:hypothetical protein